MKKEFDPYTEINNRNYPEEAHTLDLLDKHFKSAILYLFNELKEIIYKEPKESSRMMSHQIQNINNEI